MKCLLLSVALLELLLWHTGSALFLDDNCESRHWEASNNIPWMAAISNEQGFRCSGTLITKNIVLTAAQCIRGQGALFVQLGVRDISDGTGEHYNVTRSIMHREYRKEPGPNDIGLLKLHAEVNYSNRIRPICILTNNAASVLHIIDLLTVIGWSAINTKGRIPNAMNILRRPSLECNDYRITNGQLCAGRSVDNVPCAGDGGGPLVAFIGHSEVQVGIISYGPTSCKGPAIYTDVASYTNWIAANVNYLKN